MASKRKASRKSPDWAPLLDEDEERLPVMGPTSVRELCLACCVAVPSICGLILVFYVLYDKVVK